MTDRTLLRRGAGTSPPAYMRPGELAYSPGDLRLWIADSAGVAHPVSGIGGGSITVPPGFDSTTLTFDSTALTFDAA